MLEYFLNDQNDLYEQGLSRIEDDLLSYRARVTIRARNRRLAIRMPGRNEGPRVAPCECPVELVMGFSIDKGLKNKFREAFDSVRGAREQK